MSKKDFNMAGSIAPSATELTFNVTKSSREATDSKQRELIKEETRLVKGIFQCFETPGSSTKIVVRKYPERLGVPMFEKVMTDGETYEIPLYVARHLNGIDVSSGALGNPNTRNINLGTCSYAVHGFKYQNGMAPQVNPGQDAGIPVPIVGVAKRVRRFGFQSLEFAGDFT